MTTITEPSTDAETIRAAIDNIRASTLAILDAETPVYASMGPLPTFTMPPTPKFSVMGHNRRKKMAANTRRVLANEGFPS